MFKTLSAQDIGRLIVSFALILMFAFALVFEIVWGQDAQTKNLLIGALIGSFSTGAVQYWFSTSPGSAAKDTTIAQMAANTANALEATPPATPVAPVAPVAPSSSS